ncbi:hypothetical protein [Streptomyces phaeochromogenes]|uniref:hypothetical protein n=1 Tax=Streptomyces phaeochromogenes TaxID=1923 RepID=UPI00386C168D|nr:hypothetical protein OG277_38315 [Streptomyces phaeochromogenes]
MPISSSQFAWVVGGVSIFGVIVTVSTGAPRWVAVLFIGALICTVLLMAISNPAGRIAAAIAVTAATGIAAGATLVRAYPNLAGVESRQPSPKSSRTEQSKQQVSGLKVSGLKGGDAIPRCMRIKGTGTIPLDKEVWVGHTNASEENESIGTLMNLREAENVTGKPGEWHLTDGYRIGEEEDNRTFWIYVYEVPSSTGDVIRQWKWPDGFKKEQSDWQPALTAPFASVEPMASFEVTRTDNPGCDA